MLPDILLDNGETVLLKDFFEYTDTFFGVYVVLETCHHKDVSGTVVADNVAAELTEDFGIWKSEEKASVDSFIHRYNRDIVSMAILDSLRNSGVVVHDIREKNKCRESLIWDEAEYSGRLFIHGSVYRYEDYRMYVEGPRRAAAGCGINP